ncbi:Uncharacterized protein P5673_019006, partial [Acropora cervicornis]
DDTELSKLPAVNKDEIHSVGRGKKVSSSKEASKPNVRNCTNCGVDHSAKLKSCPAFGRKCLYCGKLNHFEKLSNDQCKDDLFVIDAVSELRCKREIFCTMKINGKPVELKIDTGAKCNLNVVQLVAYGGDTLPTCNLEFDVVDRPVTPLLVLADSLNMDLVQLHSEVHEVDTIDAFQTAVFNEYKDSFEGHLDNLPVVYKMRLDPNFTPVVRPPRKVTLAMEECAKTELERMVKIGVVTPVSEPTEWVSQMVAARKKDGSIRICIDPQDLNKALRRPHHPMRSVEDVALRMPNASVISTLDARSGFWQINLDHESSLLTTLSTPFGRYRFLHMPSGITSAFKVFQQYIQLLNKGHSGADATTRGAKDIVYWLSMMLEIDSTIALCQPCNSAKPHQQKDPLLIHPVPELPWFLDRGAKPLPPLNPQQVVRLQTSKGYEKVGVVKQPTSDPRSYIANVGKRESTVEIGDI